MGCSSDVKYHLHLKPRVKSIEHSILKCSFSYFPLPSTAIAVDLRETSPAVEVQLPPRPKKKKDKVIHFTGYPLAREVNRYPLSETLHLLSSAPHRELHT